MDYILNDSNSVYIKKKFSDSRNGKEKEQIYKLNTDIRFNKKKTKKKQVIYKSIDIPVTFDSSLRDNSTPVVDQESCGCCFAISSSTCISDVFVFGMNMSFNPDLSAMYILSSINVSSNKKCDGGNPYDILEFIESNGISTNICVSYHNACLNNPYCNGSSKDQTNLDKMIPSNGCCNNKTKHYLYYIKNLRVETDVNQIKTHIYQYGCAIGGFTVYENFQDSANNKFSDTDGIYFDKGTDMNETPKGYHAICIVGWGEKNNIKYWICRNSWGKDWGDNGYFKYAMYDKGINERNALEKIYTTDDGDVGGIILFEPNGAKRFDNPPLSNCIFLNELTDQDRKVLQKYYDTDETSPTDKTGKTISEPQFNTTNYSIYVGIAVGVLCLFIIIYLYNK